MFESDSSSMRSSPKYSSEASGRDLEEEDSAIDRRLLAGTGESKTSFGIGDGDSFTNP